MKAQIFFHSLFIGVVPVFGCGTPGDPELLEAIRQPINQGTPISDTESYNIGIVRIAGAQQIQAGGCTGTLLNPSWVLTAAHCFDVGHDADRNGEIDPPVLALPEPVYRVFQGNGRLDAPPPYVDPDRVVKHPAGAWGPERNIPQNSTDVALVHLRTPMSFSPPANHLTGGRMAMYTGPAASLLNAELTCYGYGDNGAILDGNLRYGKLKVTGTFRVWLNLQSVVGNKIGLTGPGD